MPVGVVWSSDRSHPISGDRCGVTWLGLAAKRGRAIERRCFPEDPTGQNAIHLAGSNCLCLVGRVGPASPDSSTSLGLRVGLAVVDALAVADDVLAFESERQVATVVRPAVPDRTLP